MLTLPIRSVREAVQAAGFWHGTPCVAVELADRIEPALRVGIERMFAKAEPDRTYAALSAPDALAAIGSRFTARHIVITGAEPCVYNLADLVAVLSGVGASVQIETKGGTDVADFPLGWVTLYVPRASRPRPSATSRANEIIASIGSSADIERLDEIAAATAATTIWLKAAIGVERADELCISAARERGWRVALRA